MLTDINIKKTMEPPEIYDISRNLSIKIQNVQVLDKIMYKYSDVILINKELEKEAFIGRFIEPISKVKVSYNNGKILVYHDEYNSEIRCDVITCVLSLYDILDDFSYSCTEKEALNIFDDNLTTDYLQDKNSSIVKSDLERKKLKRL